MAQSTIVGQEIGVKSGEVRRKAAPSEKQTGVKFRRRYTLAGEDPLKSTVWERRQSVITNPDGSVVFKMEGVEIPSQWSQLATDIVVSKYFRKAGLHGDKDQGEVSVRQVVERISKTIRRAGEDFGGYFESAEDAQTFEDELTWMLCHQYGAFNSPVWFNCGLFHQYGIEGSGGNWAWNQSTDTFTETANAYSRPQCSACFIQAVSDDLMGI